MKKIIFSLSIVIGVAALATGATLSYFSDKETSKDNTITTGTVDIDVDGQNPWTGKYEMDNMQPGDTKEISFTIHNVGDYPVKLWKIIKNLDTEENGVVEPEQDWYDTNNGGHPKNDIDTAMVYEMYVDGQIAVEKEAGITLDKIKDYYMNLVKLDKATDPSYTGPDPNGSGILNPGGSITVVQKYHLKEDTGNWAQSDKMTFDIEILAQQVDAPEPVKQLSFMNNKFVSGDWHTLADTKIGLLKYDSTAQKFNYDFSGVGLNPATEYCLIYYADPNGNGTGGSTGALIDKGNPSGNGELALNGSKDLGDLPNINDTNYPIGGAKIWMLPCASYSQTNHKVSSWNLDTNNWLFDNWPGFIKYTKGEISDETDTDDPSPPSSPPATPTTENVKIDDVLSTTDWTNQPRDYSSANVNFSYQTPATSQLSGTITATGLKPYTTYQAKFIGKPTCDGPGGDDTANEYIGYKGRWTALNSSCTGADCNREDSDYITNKAKADGDSSKECIAGYLLWGFFTTDASGNATKSVTTDSSYHVLWCKGGTCGAVNNNSLLKYQPAAGLDYHYCDANDVEGQIERGTCGSLTLNSGDYDLKLVLTEESFHQPEGAWTTVLQKDINFTIN
jgi:predicted ribosomally synthesized peptide with SipW-like signal peptide